MEEDFCFDEDEELTDCPNCQRTYDDADFDFRICSKCGYDADNGTIDNRRISGRNRVGLDPDYNDVW